MRNWPRTTNLILHTNTIICARVFSHMTLLTCFRRLRLFQENCVWNVQLLLVWVVVQHGQVCGCCSCYWIVGNCPKTHVVKGLNCTDMLACLLIYLLIYLFTARSRVFPQKLAGCQLVKFPTFYGIRRFITAFTSARHLSLSSARLIQYMPHPIPLLEDPF